MTTAEAPATTPARRKRRKWSVEHLEAMHVLYSHGPDCQLRKQAAGQWRDGKPVTVPCALLAQCGCESPRPKTPLITLYTGLKGSGKTLSMVGQIAGDYAAGIEVIHNGALRFGHELDIHSFLANTYRGVILAFDELEEYLNNLRSSSNLAVDFIGVLIQLRHQDCSIAATTQFAREINGRFLKRVDLRAACVTPDQGQRVYRNWTTWPYLGGGSLSDHWHDVLENAGRYHQLYKHQQYVAVGQVRVTARMLGAAQEIQRDRLIWGVVVDAARRDYDSVTTAEVQQALAGASPPVTVSRQMIGRTLREFRLVEDRAGTTRVWCLTEEVRAQALGNTDAA